MTTITRERLEELERQERAMLKHAPHTASENLAIYALALKGLAFDELSRDFNALQRALVGNTGLSAIMEAERLRNLDPLPTPPGGEQS